MAQTNAQSRAVLVLSPVYAGARAGDVGARLCHRNRRDLCDEHERVRRKNEIVERAADARSHGEEAVGILAARHLPEGLCAATEDRDASPLRVERQPSRILGRLIKRDEDLRRSPTVLKGSRDLARAFHHRETELAPRGRVAKEAGNHLDASILKAADLLSHVSFSRVVESRAGRKALRRVGMNNEQWGRWILAAYSPWCALPANLAAVLFLVWAIRAVAREQRRPLPWIAASARHWPLPSGARSSVWGKLAARKDGAMQETAAAGEWISVWLSPVATFLFDVLFVALFFLAADLFVKLVGRLRHKKVHSTE